MRVTTEEQHTCGYTLMKVQETIMIDVTSIDDIPEDMRPTFIPGVGYVGGVSFANLPYGYHKFMPMVKLAEWFDQGIFIDACPSCGQALE